jgi:23S rRNA (uracil1939-C5)-methyltransferase
MIYHIEDIAFGGEGVARQEGLAVFIPFTLPQEKVQATIIQKKSKFARASLEQILEKSPDRIEPLCPYFSRCGGCQLQHATYAKQLEIKRKFVSDSLARIGKISFPVPPVHPSCKPFSYRRHISLNLKPVEGSWRLCFTSFDLKPLAISQCVLFHKPLDSLLSQMQTIASGIPFASRVKLFKAQEKYICAFFCEEPIPQELLSPLLSIDSIQGLIVQTPEKTLEWGDCHLTFSCQGLLFSYSPFSFVQNHPEQSEAIISLILELSQESQKVLDLYCGIGVSTLALAKKGKDVIGVEVNEHAILLAKQNAEQNNLPSALFFCEPAERCQKHIESFQPDMVLVNPPKTGLDLKVLQELSSKHIEKIIYVSCHPATLARDAALLLKMHYDLVLVQSFDMFPQTTHVETVIMRKRLINPSFCV